jgi:hypothetical protein
MRVIVQKVEREKESKKEMVKEKYYTHTLTHTEEHARSSYIKRAKIRCHFKFNFVVW